MKIIVQKFGGTSVSTKERRQRVVEKIIKAKNAGYSPVVVVSAMGRKGEPYATDTLLSLVSNELKKNNLAIDLLMSCGEIISTVVMADELLSKNIDAVPLTGGQAGILTDDNYSNASILKLECDKILDVVEENKIPIVAGFQGISENGFITTLGRGGSDVTAVLLGGALKAEKVEIYTDVDGIMTADPRIVSDATLIKEISYNETFQFSHEGAKVIHPRAVEIAMNENIPIVIKNTLTNCDGTLINNISDLNLNNIITGITHTNDRTQIKIELEQNKENESYFRILDILAENSISIDLINVFPRESIFTIDEKDFEKFSSIMNKINLKYSHIDSCSKIAIIGNRMRGIPGVMAKIIYVLMNENIEVLQTADSHATIWCLVKDIHTEKAIKALHNAFNLSNNK
ncbi:aspartokinase [Clostridium tetani]|uniref:aspartate kinase n=1 Tax=Clostridium tetani TaxID=1513 RepID=UPI0029538001|nr:aspartate kinase [Clostridium tetani]BDR66924.1 aspartokinase [Clostridium tetani]BDR72411.1 aspartokinase [Clostridium tetani]